MTLNGTVLPIMAMRGGVMRSTESGRAKMRNKESLAKNQGRINLGRAIVVGVNKYRINKDNGENGDGNRD